MTPENGQQMIVRPSAGSEQVARRGFGETSIEARNSAAVAVAERAKAEVQARYVVAMQRPRSFEEARRRVLDHCKRRKFAEAARYAKPVGGQSIVGPSIRFVEAALQEYGNVLPECTVVYDDAEQRIVRVSVTDLERNVCYSRDVPVRKVVERRKLRPGQEAIGQRRNSGGHLVYLVEATEDDLAVKQGAAESKALRTLGLRILPADLVEDAMDAVARTLHSADAEDPAAARRRMVDAFAALGVYPRQLEEYLGHPLEQTTPAEREALLVVHATLKDGEATWAEVLEARRTERGESSPAAGGDADAAPAEPAKKPSKAAQALKQKLDARKAKKSPPRPTEGPAERDVPAATRAEGAEAKAPPSAPQEPRGEATQEPAAGAEAASAEGDDDFVREVRAIWKGLETCLAKPETVPQLRARVDALPPCGDREMLDSALQGVERKLAEEAKGGGR